MTDKCEACGGLGIETSIVFSSAVGTRDEYVPVRHCPRCNMINNLGLSLGEYVTNVFRTHGELVAALEEIALGVGAIAGHGPLEHRKWFLSNDNIRLAANTIERMKQVAEVAIAKAQPVKESTTA